MNIYGVVRAFGRLLGTVNTFGGVSNARRARALMHDTSKDEMPLEARHPIVHLDMNLSSSFDELNPDHAAVQSRPVWLPMTKEIRDDMRAFYTGILNMSEIQAPSYATDSDMLWLTNGFRTLCLGQKPGFAYVTEYPPSFRLPQLDDVYAGLIAAGHETRIDDSLAYVRRMTVKDPAGNELAFVGA